MAQFLDKSLEELPLICSDLVTLMNKDGILLLLGEMGSGKTTLVRELCRQLGATDEVSSPTYSIVNEYRTEENKKIFHFDLYRLKNREEAMDIGIEEYLKSGHLCIIEWPEIIYDLLPIHYNTLKISLSGGRRNYQLLLNEPNF